MHVHEIEDHKIYPDTSLQYSMYCCAIENPRSLPDPEQFPNLRELKLFGFSNKAIPYYPKLRTLIYSPYSHHICFNLLLPEHGTKLTSLTLSYCFKKVPFFINVNYYEIAPHIRYNVQNRKIIVSLFEKGHIREKYLLRELFIVHKPK
jgi:uncharacterized Zn-finger protein